jgi:hypothetical protein
MSNAAPVPDEHSQSANPLKWVAIGCGGCLGLSVLLVGVLAFFVSRMVSFSVDSEQVEADAQQLFDYRLPGESQGVLAMSLFGVELQQVATLETPPDVLLSMGRLPAYLQGDDAQQAFVEALQEEVTVETNYQVLDQRVESASLCGQTVNVMVQEGTYQEDQTSYHTMSYLTFVDYDGDTRFAWILAHGDEAPQKAEQVFQSLDCR